MKNFKNLLLIYIIIYLVINVIYLIQLYISYLNYWSIEIWIYNSIFLSITLSAISAFFIFFVYLIFFNWIFKIQLKNKIPLYFLIGLLDFIVLIFTQNTDWYLSILIPTLIYIIWIWFYWYYLKYIKRC